MVQGGLALKVVRKGRGIHRESVLETLPSRNVAAGLREDCTLPSS